MGIACSSNMRRLLANIVNGAFLQRREQPANGAKNYSRSPPRNLINEYSSPTRFCSGVPDRHHLYFPSSAKAAFAAFVDRSLMLCASSRIILTLRSVNQHDSNNPDSPNCSHLYHWKVCIGLCSLMRTLSRWNPLCCFRNDASRVPYDTKT
jgi:hypothetical protein